MQPPGRILECHGSWQGLPCSVLGLFVGRMWEEEVQYSTCFCFSGGFYWSSRTWTTPLKDWWSISKLLLLAKKYRDLESELIVRRKQYSTITADLKVMSGTIKSLVRKPCCAALFIDLSKAFDTVDHCELRRQVLSYLNKQQMVWPLHCW